MRRRSHQRRRQRQMRLPKACAKTLRIILLALSWQKQHCVWSLAFQDGTSVSRATTASLSSSTKLFMNEAQLAMKQNQATLRFINREKSNLSENDGRAATGEPGPNRKRIPSDFMLEARQLRVRPPPCEKTGMLPLFIYRAKPKQQLDQIKKSIDASPMEYNHDDKEGIDVDNVSTASWLQELETNMASSLSTSLSKSSSALLSQWSQLSTMEQQRLRQKIQAESRASLHLNPNHVLHLLYFDNDLCVAYKPSGILSVPGPRRNPSLVNLVHDLFFPNGKASSRTNQKSSTTLSQQPPQQPPKKPAKSDSSSDPSSYVSIDQMVVHRLDMDTSGLIVYALNENALSRLHDDFRTRNVKKTYQALLVGHLIVGEMEIDLDLERDPDNLPFMRIAQPKDTNDNDDDDHDDHERPSQRSQMAETTAATSRRNHGKVTPRPAAAVASFVQKMTNQAPKPSQTQLTVLAWEYLTLNTTKTTATAANNNNNNDNNYFFHQVSSNSTSSSTTTTTTTTRMGTSIRLPVTRVQLIPHTGRTHQLRVHCAAVGHPIVGDDIYGCGGCSGGAPITTTNKNDPDSKLHLRLYQQLDTIMPLCLHAQQLCLFHPCTGAPMLLECDPPF